MRRSPVTFAASLIAALALVAGCGADPTSEEPTTEAEPASPTLTLELVTDQLTAPREVIAVAEDVLLVSDQHGTVHVIEGGELRPEPLLDLSSEVRQPTAQSLELGLAGLALARDFASSGIFYTLTTAEPGDEHPEDATRIDTVTAWTADPATLVADPSSAVVIIEVPVDGSDHVGDLTLDADGALWFGVGSPGPASPAQDPNELVGSLLRIIPDPEGGYTIPEDNPFADGGGAPEVFAYGFRNAWRSAFDEGIGVLVAEAMSRDAYQHVWQPQAGADAGYPVVGRKTKQCWVDGVAEPECLELDGVEMTPPTMEYGPEVGQIVSGVVAVRGEEYGPLVGSVLVSDWNGRVLAATPGDAPWEWTEVEVATPIGDDRYLWDLSVADGTIYASTTDPSLETGELWRVVLAG